MSKVIFPKIEVNKVNTTKASLTTQSIESEIAKLLLVNFTDAGKDELESIWFPRDAHALMGVDDD